MASPGTEREFAIEWVEHYPGRRAYNRLGNGRWIWNPEFKATPGEFFFSRQELETARGVREGFVLIEPNLPRKDVAPNKQWPVGRYQAVAHALKDCGYRVAQFANPGVRLEGVDVISAADFRVASAILSRAALYIGPEGGLHHAAAAVGTKAVVLFGGFIPPEVTGYDMHVNLASGGEACGMKSPCKHCRDAMDAIDVCDVLKPALKSLENVSGRQTVASA